MWLPEAEDEKYWQLVWYFMLDCMHGARRNAGRCFSGIFVTAVCHSANGYIPSSLSFCS